VEGRAIGLKGISTAAGWLPATAAKKYTCLLYMVVTPLCHVRIRHPCRLPGRFFRKAQRAFLLGALN